MTENGTIDTRPAKLPERICLTGRAVVIHPLDPQVHGDALWRGLGGAWNGALWSFMHYGPFDARAAFDVYLQERAESEDPLCYAIADAASGEATGLCTLMRITPRDRVIEVGGLVFSAGLQRTRGATEAMYLLARYVFEELGNRRYEWKCNASNEASRRAAMRLGFVYEGTFRQHQIVKGRNRDTAWFSMLDAEWPARRNEFERWLDESNFDAAGRQKTALGRRAALGE
jgi:RimJ/RimL family protein N-acetyltransferase